MIITGSPTTEVRDFTVQRLAAQSYVLQVQNGSMEGGSQISSAVVTLNGAVVLKQNDFNQSVYYLEEPVNLQGTNTLEVKLGSIPASHITITIVGNYLPEDVDDDGDGYTENEGDCDDIDAALNPDTVWYEDADGDDYTTGMTLTQCMQPTGYVLSAAPGDCDDTDAAVNPAAVEICNYIDNNCDGSIDEGVTTTYYQDGDLDGYGLISSTIEECSLPAGYSDNPDDCDDSDPILNPDTVWYEDADGDSFTTGVTLTQCVQPTGYVLTATAGDCNDADAAVNPSAVEVCDYIDNNCDAQVDEGVTLTFYLDADADGYGVSTDTVLACLAPAGYVDQNGDCDDADAAVNPGSAEVCNSIDDNCDTFIDEGFDTDSDGYTTCGGDCDDTASAVNPGAIEVCNAIDDNCDSAVDDGFDVDGDGYTTCGGDCDDTASVVNPSAAETCNLIDDNCDGTVDEGVTTTFYLDADGDGYGVATDTLQACSAPTGYAASSGDCDDLSFDVNPGAFEVCDGLDNDCDGTTDPGCLTGITGITVDPESFTLVGTVATQQLTVTGFYSDNTSLSLTASSTGTVYASSDTDVATVSSEGLVTAVGTGSAVITASNGVFDVQAAVTVQMLPETYIPQPEESFGSIYEDMVPPDVTIESYDEERFAIITGLVESRFGGAVGGVTVTVHDQPEYGSVFTDQTGRFSIPVNGAATLTVQYEKTGLLTIQRKVDVPWNDIGVAPTVTMLQRDPVTTQLMFTGDPADVTVHTSSETADEFGSRSLAMVITGDNRAFTYDEFGNTVYHAIINVTTTEYDTEESMPGELPPTSAYTYCSEFHSDVGDITFEKPVPIYVDNFLGFDVGMIVPVGYYNPKRAVWEAEENGVVVRLLDTVGDGVVDALDATGDGLPNDLNGSGSFADEVTGLEDPNNFWPGETYWRAEVDRFSNRDLNWPAIEAPGSSDPLLDDAMTTDGDGGGDDSDSGLNGDIECINSYCEQRGRVYHEDISVPGTGMTLHYSSDRVTGYKSVITVPASGDTVPATLKRIVVKLQVAGRTFASVLDPLPNQTVEFVWDGLDYLGRPVKGARTAVAQVGWVFDKFYMIPVNRRKAFAQPGVTLTNVGARVDSTRWSEFSIQINRTPGDTIAQGWTLSPHHGMDLTMPGTLFKGNGTSLSNGSLLIDVFVGHPDGRGYGFLGEGGLAVDAMTYAPRAIAVDKDRNVYFVDVSFALPNIWKPIILKVDNKGIVTRYAGKVLGTSSGEGGSALDRVFGSILGLAAGPNGSLFVAETTVVYMIDANGIITRYAGGGSPPDGLGNNGPATDAAIAGIEGIAADRFGNLYIAENVYSRHMVRKVSPDGFITTMAGLGPWGFSGDGGLAINAKLNRLRDIAVDKDGNVYVADSWNNRVRIITPDGIITTIAGNGQDPALVPGEYHPAEGGPATEMPIEPVRVDVDDQGNVYIITKSAMFTYERLMKVDKSGTITTIAGGGLGSPYGGSAMDHGFGDGLYLAVDEIGNSYISLSKHHRVLNVFPAKSETGSIAAGGFAFLEEGGIGHIMDEKGLHVRTTDLNHGVDLLTYGYDGDGALTSVMDRFGNQTTVQRDAAGNPTAIVSPDGLVTGLTIDGNNHLKQVNYPDGSFYSMTYAPDGLMTDEYDPVGNRFTNLFNENGRVEEIADPEGGRYMYDRQVMEDGTIMISFLTAEGDLTTYEDRTDSTGKYTSVTTSPDGSQSTFINFADEMTSEKQMACGTDLNFSYSLDREYGYKVGTGSTMTLPSALSVTTTRSRTYSDSDAIGTSDLITDTVIVNGKTSTVVNDVLTGTVTATSPTGRQVASYYSPTTLLTSRTSAPGLLDTDFTYDTRGRLETVSVGTRTTTFAYDGYGYLDFMTTPDGRTFDYTYDIMGRLTGEDRPDGGQVDYSYDDNGNVTAIVNPNTITYGFTYTANDQRESYNTPVSGSYVYQYDRDRRLKSVTYPSGQTITNTWATGQLQSTTTPEGLITYGYDCGGKLGSVNKGGESASYTYDGSLLLTDTRAGTISESISYGYNADLQVGSITYAGATDSFLYDNDGLLTDAGAYSITRDAANGLPEAVSDGTVTQGRDFSSYGEVDGIDYTVGATAPYSWSVVRDNAGRITQKVENIGAATVTWDYTYDSLGRLETVYKDSIMAEAYSYDGQGNRLEETNVLRGVSRTYTHDDEDKIVWAGLDFYQYDMDGFLTSRSIASGANSGITTFDYSSRGELLSATLPDSMVLAYHHDSFGRRVSKSVNGAIIEKYLWASFMQNIDVPSRTPQLMAIYDGSDNLIQRFEYADGRVPVAMTYQGAVYYFAYDQVGSLRAVFDSAGNEIKRVDYDSFGNILSDSNPAFSVPFGFAGGLDDRDTGLVRFGARDFDSATGKWTAKDSIDFGGEDINLGSYVQNDPINYTDPNGEIGQYIAAAVCGVALLAGIINRYYQSTKPPETGINNSDPSQSGGLPPTGGVIPPMQYGPPPPPLTIGGR